MSNDAPTPTSENLKACKFLLNMSLKFPLLSLCLFATLKMRRKLSRVNFHKDFSDCYWGQGNNLTNS